MKFLIIKMIGYLRKIVFVRGPLSRMVVVTVYI